METTWESCASSVRGASLSANARAEASSTGISKTACPHMCFLVAATIPVLNTCSMSKNSRHPAA